jgi:AraC-like DNA-binding protein
MQEPIVRFWSVDHWHPMELRWAPTVWSRLIFAPRGILRIGGESAEWTLPPTHAFFVRPGAAYSVHCSAKTQLRIAYLREPLDVPDGALKVSALLRELILEADRLAPLYGEDPVGHSLALLIEDQIRRASRLDTEVPMPFDATARGLARRVLESPEKSLQDHLGETPMSRRTLERRFQEEAGMSLGRWHQRARLMQSVLRLEEGASVSDAAFAAGYVSPSAFIQAFRGHFGKTPGQFVGSL